MSESNNFVCEEKQGRKENILYRVTLLVLVVLLSKYAQNPQFLHCLCIGPATNRSRESNISSWLFLCLSIGLSICSYFIIQGNPTKGKLDNIFLPQKPPIVYCNIQGERSSFQSPFLFDLWLLFVSLCIYSSCVPAQVACGWSLTGIICKIFVLTVTMFRNHLTCVCCADHQIPHLLWCVHCVLMTDPTKGRTSRGLSPPCRLLPRILTIPPSTVWDTDGQLSWWCSHFTPISCILPVLELLCLLDDFCAQDVVVYLVMHAHTALERQHTDVSDSGSISKGRMS